MSMNMTDLRDVLAALHFAYDNFISVVDEYKSSLKK